MQLPFYKYQATGNDFILLDNRENQLSGCLSQAQIKRLCHRRFGIGADGLILLQEKAGFDFYMQYYNADGRESTMCGNGGRSLVAFARHLGIKKDLYTFEAIDGLHHARLVPEGVELQMTSPQGYRQLSSDRYWIDTGSPHYVAFYSDPVAELPVYELGRQIRYDKVFAPGGTNVNFVNILAENRLAVRTYERGVEDETLSCGTGVTACALVYLKIQQKTAGKVQLESPGGLLSVSLDMEGRVFLTGPAQLVFEGRVDLNHIN